MSTAESEVAGTFHNAQTILPIRGLLEALVQRQQPTPLKIDNPTANDFVRSNIIFKNLEVVGYEIVLFMSQRVTVPI